MFFVDIDLCELKGHTFIRILSYDRESHNVSSFTIREVFQEQKTFCLELFPSDCTINSNNNNNVTNSKLLIDFSNDFFDKMNKAIWYHDKSAFGKTQYIFRINTAHFKINLGNYVTYLKDWGFVKDDESLKDLITEMEINFILHDDVRIIFPKSLLLSSSQQSPIDKFLKEMRHESEIFVGPKVFEITVICSGNEKFKMSIEKFKGIIEQNSGDGSIKGEIGELCTDLEMLYLGLDKFTSKNGCHGFDGIYSDGIKLIITDSKFNSSGNAAQKFEESFNKSGFAKKYEKSFLSPSEGDKKEDVYRQETKRIVDSFISNRSSAKDIKLMIHLIKADGSSRFFVNDGFTRKIINEFRAQNINIVNNNVIDDNTCIEKNSVEFIPEPEWCVFEEGESGAKIEPLSL